MSVTVAVNGVEKSYGAVKALRNVSFDLGPGRLSALVQDTIRPRARSVSRISFLAILP